MSWNIVRLDAVAATPWRNGGGVTRELLAWPDGRGWRVRMSLAEVAQDGPFSRFEGVRRWFAVLDGAGVRLRLEGGTHELTRQSAPFDFDGASATDCELLAGPTLDFNLMLRGAGGRMRRVCGPYAPDCAAARLVALYTGQGASLALGTDTLEIGPRTLAWRILDAETNLHIDSQDALWMEIDP